MILKHDGNELEMNVSRR